MPSDASPPHPMPVTTTSAPSSSIVVRTCSGVAPASRCWPNSRRRAEIAAASVFTIMIAAKTLIMPTTT